MTTPSNDALKDANHRIDSFTQGLLLRIRSHGSVTRMVIVLVAAFALFAFLNPRVFLGPLNLQNIMVAAPEVGVIAIAMMLAMLTGGIDLSLVSIANLSAIAMSTMFTSMSAASGAFNEGMAFPVFLVGIGIGLACGLLNGLLIGIVGITPILATLGTMQILNGIAIVWTGGTTLYGAPATFTTLGKLAVGPIPVLFVIFLIAAVLVAFLINATPLGRKAELQGANPVAAQFSGIRSKKVLIGCYTIGGALGGLAGFLFIARNPTASADYGASYVLLVIVIAVLGGTNPNGGFASVAGVVLATLTLQVVSSGFTAMRLSSYQYAIAQGVILIAVMVIDAINWKRPKKRAVAVAAAQ